MLWANTRRGSLNLLLTAHLLATYLICIKTVVDVLGISMVGYWNDWCLFMQINANHLGCVTSLVEIGLICKFILESDIDSSLSIWMCISITAIVVLFFIHGYTRYQFQ